MDRHQRLKDLSTKRKRNADKQEDEVSAADREALLIQFDAGMIGPERNLLTGDYILPGG